MTAGQGRTSGGALRRRRVALDAEAVKRAHHDKDFANEEAGVAFEIEECDAGFFTDRLRFRRKARRDQNRSGIRGEIRGGLLEVAQSGVQLLASSEACTPQASV